MLNKKIKNATEITVDNIKFRSKLEEFTYRTFKESDIKLDYEKHKFILLPSFIFGNNSYENSKSKGFINNTTKVRAITYTPDFVNLEKRIIIECKGFATEVFNIKLKLFKYLINTDKLNFDIYIPRNQKQVKEVLNILKNNYDSNG